MSSNNKEKENKWYDYKWKLIVPAILLIFGCFLGYFIKDPPQNPHVTIFYDSIVHKAFEYKIPNDLSLSFNDNEKISFSRYKFEIVSDGAVNDKNFKIHIYTKNKNSEIPDCKLIFEKQTLKENIIKEENSKNKFYWHINPLPIGAKMEVFLKLPFNVDEKDFAWEFMSDYSIYEPEKREINLYQPIGLKRNYKLKNNGIAYADEIDKNQTLNKSTETESGRTEKEKLKCKNGITAGFRIGGYDPIIFVCLIFNHLAENKILNNDEIDGINNMIENYNSPFHGVSGSGVSFGGIKFGGFSFLKFYELSLNAMIRGKILSYNQGKEILDKSKQAGGIQINGYNFIVMDIEILNALLINKNITREKAQKIIEMAKQKRLIFENGSGSLLNLE